MPLHPSRPARRPLGGHVRSMLVRRLVANRGAVPTGPPLVGAGGGGGGAAGQTVNPYDYSGDATYQRIHGLNERNTASAEATALERRKQLAIEQGDPSLAPDAETAAAASANPFSVMAHLAKRRAEEPRALTEADNSQNLFYSGAAAKHQSDLVRSLLESETNARSDARSRVSAIDADLASARQSAADEDVQAQEEAAARRRDQLGDTPVGYQGIHEGTPMGGAGAGAIRRLAHRRIQRPMRPRRLPHLPLQP